MAFFFCFYNAPADPVLQGKTDVKKPLSLHLLAALLAATFVIALGAIPTLAVATASPDAPLGTYSTQQSAILCEAEPADPNLD